MRIRILCPARRGSLSGNRLTAERWARILRGLGHRVAIDVEGKPAPCDLIVALHARRSARAAARYARCHPEARLVVALTGTDLYRDLRRSAAAGRTLERADAIVALQPLAAASLPRRLRPKVVTILQSATASGRPAPRRARTIVRGAVLAHLRAVKDPFRPALALRRLPAGVRVEIVHAGAALSPAMERRAKRESAANRRWRWVGALPRSQARRLLRASDLTVVPSRIEGGAHVVGEAIVEGVPVLASRIPGNVGLLGRRYRGYFKPGDTGALARLLVRFARDAALRAALRRAVRRLAPAFDPREERRRWAALLERIERPSRGAGKTAANLNRRHE